MALQVVANLTDIDLAESATPWTSGSLDPAKFVQGSNSIGWYAPKNNRTANGVSSKSIAWSAGDHLYTWQASDVAALMEPKTTGTTTASGVTVRVTLANGDHREWHVTGGGTWDGGWECFVIDLGHTGSQLYSSSGTFPDTSNITDVDIYYDLSNSGNIRNVPANCYADAIRVGTGITAYNANSTDAAFDFSDIAAIADATAQKYGVLYPLDLGAKSLGCVGRVIIGDTGTNHLDFLTSGETVEMLERNGAGLGIVGDGLYGVEVVANSTASDQDFQMGVKVGTGDAMTGRNGTKISAGGPSVVWYFDSTDADLHNFKMYGSTLEGATGGTTYGVALDSPTTTFELGGCTFDNCEQIDFADAVVRNPVVLNTAAAATSAAVLWTEGEFDVEYGLFVNNPRAIEVGQITTTAPTFTGMEFQGNTFDVLYTGTDDWDLPWTDAPAAPTVDDDSTGVLTPVNTVTLTLNGVVSGSNCSIHAAAGGVETVGTELMNEVASGSTVTEPYAYTSSQPVWISVRNSQNGAGTRYLPVRQPGTITGDGLTATISQVVDPVAATS